MKQKSVLFIEFLIIGVVTVVAIFNTRFELFNIEGLVGWVFSGLSFIYLPGHIGAMLLTNAADPPDLWGVIIGYLIQGFLITIVVRQITLVRYKGT